MAELKNNKALLLLVLGAISIGFAPVFIKFVALKGMGLNAIAFWRMAISGTMLFTITIARGKSPSMPIQNILWAALAGFILSLDFGIWHRSIMFVGAGLSTILGNTQVFNTAILSYLIFKEKLTGRFFVAAFAAMIGVTLLTGIGSDIHFTEKYVWGIVFGLFVGLLYAFYLIVLRKVSTSKAKPDTMTFIAWICLFCTIFMGSASFFESGKFMPPDLISWTYFIGLGLLVQVFGWWAIFSSMSKIETSRVGLVLLLQPALATVWGYLLFKENLSILQVSGGILTLASIYYGIKSRTKTKG